MKNILVSGNLGKTVFSFYLARELSSKNKKVVVVSPDITVSTAFTLFFDSDTEKSIGKLLARPVLTKQEVFSQMYFAGDNLSYLSYSSLDRVNTYPEIIQENCERLFDLLSDTADYVIVDSRKNPGSIEKFFSSRENLIELNVCSADRRGIAHRKIYSLNNKRVNIILENNTYSNPSEIYLTYQHKPKYTLPYCKVLGAVYTAAKISEISPPKAYLKIIKSIIKGELLC